jgi:hypothetical protein
VVVCLALAGFATLNAHLRCLDAAREAARLIARGEPGTAQEAVHQIAPPGARFSVRTNADHIEVEVSAPLILPGLDITARAFAVAEPTAEDDPPPPTGVGS